MAESLNTSSPPSALQGCLQRYLRGFALQVGVIFAMLLLWGGCVAVGMPALMLLQAPSDVAFLLTFIGGLAVTLPVVIGGIVLWRVRHDRGVDRAFAPLGFQGRMYMISGRRYQGTFQGAPVEMFYYRGPIFDIFLEAPFGTEAAFGVDNVVARFAADLLQREPLETGIPRLADFRVFAKDPAWLQRVLADDVAREAVLTLLHAPAPGSPLLQFQADRLLLRFAYARIGSVTTEQLRTWLEAMATLARRLTDLPPPTVTTKPQLLDRQVRNSRLTNPLVIALIALGIVFVTMSCGLGLVMLVVAAAGGF